MYSLGMYKCISTKSCDILNPRLKRPRTGTCRCGHTNNVPKMSIDKPLRKGINPASSS